VSLLTTNYYQFCDLIEKSYTYLEGEGFDGRETKIVMRVASLLRWSLSLANLGVMEASLKA